MPSPTPYRPAEQSRMNPARTCGLISVVCMVLLSCGGGSGNSSGSSGTGSPVLNNYHLTGAPTPDRDPSLTRQGTTSYLFSTDAGGPIPGHLPMRCSTDKINWQLCGAVFNQIPMWVQAQVPGIDGLWAPDISYFNGLYHVYYAGSTFGSNTSVIGLVTNTTLDPSDPADQRVDQVQVRRSCPADGFTAIDP